MVLLADSEALISDIRFALEDRWEIMSSDSITEIERYLQRTKVKLLIVDMDIKSALWTEVLEGLRSYEGKEIKFLFLASESRKLEIEKIQLNSIELLLSASWLIKPFSRNTLQSSVKTLFGVSLN